MNPQHFGTDPAEIRIGIRINPESNHCSHFGYGGVCDLRYAVISVYCSVVFYV